MPSSVNSPPPPPRLTISVMATAAAILFLLTAVTSVSAARRETSNQKLPSFRPPSISDPRGLIHYKTTYACEGNPLHLSCEAGRQIHLVRANYGRFSISTCNDGGQLDMSVNCMSYRSFLIMTDRCSQQSNCSVTVSSKLFGDPCPGTHKYLEVQYHCTPGAASSTSTTSTTSTVRPPNAPPNVEPGVFINNLLPSVGNRHDLPQSLPGRSTTGAGSEPGGADATSRVALSRDSSSSAARDQEAPVAGPESVAMTRATNWLMSSGEVTSPSSSSSSSRPTSRLRDRTPTGAAEEDDSALPPVRAGGDLWDTSRSIMVKVPPPPPMLLPPPRPPMSSFDADDRLQEMQPDNVHHRGSSSAEWPSSVSNSNVQEEEIDVNVAVSSRADVDRVLLSSPRPEVAVSSGSPRYPPVEPRTSGGSVSLTVTLFTFAFFIASLVLFICVVRMDFFHHKIIAGTRLGDCLWPSSEADEDLDECAVAKVAAGGTTGPMLPAQLNSPAYGTGPLVTKVATQVTLGSPPRGQVTTSGLVDTSNNSSLYMSRPMLRSLALSGAHIGPNGGGALGHHQFEQYQQNSGALTGVRPGGVLGSQVRENRYYRGLYTNMRGQGAGHITGNGGGGLTGGGVVERPPLPPVPIALGLPVNVMVTGGEAGGLGALGALGSNGNLTVLPHHIYDQIHYARYEKCQPYEVRT